MRAAVFAGLGIWLVLADPPTEDRWLGTKPVKPDTEEGERLNVDIQQIAFTSSACKDHDTHCHEAGHIIKVKNPKNRFSVTPALPNGCGTVAGPWDTQKIHKPRCRVAIDAGYFELHKDVLFDCIGNLVCHGQIHNLAPLNTSNVQFGVLKNGSYAIGYISDEEVKKGHFKHLVAGLGYLVKDGKNYVKEGWKEAYTKAGSSGDEYISMTSGRTGIGYTADGELILIQFPGHTHLYAWGATMMELADKLIEFGVVEAINLDGGGSTQLWYLPEGAVEGVEMGYSSDRNTYGVMLGVYKEGCPIGEGKTNISSFQCQRKVSSLICLHEDDTEFEKNEQYFHTPAFGRLVANVSKGEDKIVIEEDRRRPGATFAKGQKIMIAIQKSWLQNETKTIKAINGGEITLDSGLKFDYEARSPVIQQHPKNELLVMAALGEPAMQASTSSSGPFSAWATAMLVMGCVSGGVIGFFAKGRSNSDPKARGLTLSSEESDAHE